MKLLILTQKTWFGVFVTGVLGIFIYPTVLFGFRFPDMGFLAWFYLVPLLISLQGQSFKKQFGLSFVSGLISYTACLYWLAPAMKNFGGLSLSSAVGVLSLVILIPTVPFALGIPLTFWIASRIRFSFPILLALFLCSFDFLRIYFPFGGFPWPLVGYSQGEYVSFFQWVDVTGVFGLSFLIYLVNGLLFQAIVIRKEKQGVDVFLKQMIFVAMLFMISFSFSLYRHHIFQKKAYADKSLSIALIQGNISQDLKWDSRKARQHLNRFQLMAEKGASIGAQLAVWPETAYPYGIDLSLLTEKRAFEKLTPAIPVLTGVVSEMPTATEEEPRLYNSAILVNREGYPEQVYHKMHLVPFGEYVPLRHWLRFARRLTASVGDFTPGSNAAFLVVDGVKIGTLICYEDIFPSISRQFSLQGADLLVNISNDAWYGNSSAPYQHLAFSQFRALENRRYLVRATNTGMTAVIDPRGVVMRVLPPFTQDMLLTSLSLERMDSFYTQVGDWIAWIFIVLSILSLAYALRKNTLPTNKENYVS